MGRNGGKNPQRRGSSLWTPFSGGVVWGSCTSHLLPWPAALIEGPCGRPPAGRAEDVGEYPLGEGREEPFGSPLFSPSANLLLPPAPSRWAGHEALVLEAAGQAYLTNHLSPFLSPEMGFQGKNLLPLGVLSYFFKEIGPRPGGLRSRPFQRRREKPTRAPRPGRPTVPTAPGPPIPSPRCPYSPKTATDSPAYPAGPPGAGRHRPPPPPGRCPPSSGRARRGSLPGRRPAGQRRPG